MVRDGSLGPPDSSQIVIFIVILYIVIIVVVVFVDAVIIFPAIVFHHLVFWANDRLHRIGASNILHKRPAALLLQIAVSDVFLRQNDDDCVCVAFFLLAQPKQNWSKHETTPHRFRSSFSHSWIMMPLPLPPLPFLQSS